MAKQQSKPKADAPVETMDRRKARLEATIQRIPEFLGRDDPELIKLMRSKAPK